VLAGDDVLLREGLASLLDRSGFDVVGQAGNSTELLALARSARPELAIIDIRMPPGHATEGLQAARVIREELPDTAIIVMSARVEVDEAMDLVAGGERTGHLLKSRVTDVAEFLDTVGRITAGASVYTRPWSGNSSRPAGPGCCGRAARWPGLRSALQLARIRRVALAGGVRRRLHR
jgi:DNA-binding NarL/FixJ family response regulator